MIKISRKKVAKNPWEYWDAFNVVLAMSETEKLSGVLRECHLVYWYASEVWKGGHRHYFNTRKGFDHQEVLGALKNLGAGNHALIFQESLTYLDAVEREYKDNITSDSLETILKQLDTRLYNAEPELFDFLEKIQRKNEAILVRWVD